MSCPANNCCIPNPFSYHSGVYYNTITHCTAVCVSPPSTYVAEIAAGLFTSTVSQADANAKATTACSAKALQNLICTT